MTTTHGTLTTTAPPRRPGPVRHPADGACSHPRHRHHQWRHHLHAQRRATAVEDGRDQSEVAAAHGVSWPTVQRAVVAHGAVELVEPEPTAVLGMDETRFGAAVAARRAP